MTRDSTLEGYRRANAKRAKLLGMPIGTATNRLRRQLTFRLVQILELDVCYRCSAKIDTVEEFSIDHIENWQQSSDPVAAFFDLDNVAFSHRSCNIRAGSKPTKLDLTPLERGRRKYAMYNDRINEGRRKRRKKTPL